MHKSNAAAYMPFELMQQYGEIYDGQEIINEAANSAYAELQKAISVLNGEEEDQNRSDMDQALREYAITTGKSRMPSVEQMSAVYSRMSGKKDLSRLTPGHVDRLEQGFQQAITDDHRLHRLYVYLEGLYAMQTN